MVRNMAGNVARRALAHKAFSNVSRDRRFYGALLSLALPIVLQNLMNNSLALIDTFMVGKLGEESLGGVALANTVFFVVTLLSFGLQSGGSVLISQYWGKRDHKTINRILGIGFGLSAAIGVAVAAVVVAAPERLYALTSNEPALVAIAARYARIAAFSIVLNNITMVYLSAQRSMGNTRLGMGVLMISTASNTFLNWVLIFGNLGFPALGVEGAAISMLVARVIEITVTSVYALRVSEFRLKLRALLRPGAMIFKDFLRFSMPVVANETLWGIGFSLYAIMIGHLPNAVSGVAAYSITLSVERLMSAVYFGVGNAAAVLVGNPLGAGDIKSAKTAGVTILAVTTVTGAAAGALMLALSLTVIKPHVLPLFAKNQETINICGFMLAVLSVLSPCRAYNFCNIVGLFRAGGDVRIGVLLDAGCMYGVALPAAALAGFVFGAPVAIVYLCMGLEEIVKVFLVNWRYRKYKWLKNVTRELAG
jgi:putative MATE family efflux protein